MNVQYPTDSFYREGVYSGERGDLFASHINKLMLSPLESELKFDRFVFTPKDNKLKIAYDDINEVYWEEEKGFYFV